MNLDFRSEQALAGARAFQQAQQVRHGDAQRSIEDREPAELLPGPATTPLAHAA